MKKITTLITALLLNVSIVAFTGCGSQAEDPGPPPTDVVNPENAEDTSVENDTGNDIQNEDDGTSDEADILENAVSVRIGQDGQTDWLVDMYNNAAAETMLGYLSGSGLLFPTYTYDEEQGFVAQNVRGNYFRDDETTIGDVQAGDLYLFGDGQLRLYFKDVEGADITATPIGYFVETEGLTETVQEAYESNRDDVWGVDVYFIITKKID